MVLDQYLADIDGAVVVIFPLILLAVDIPPIGEGMVVLSQYSLPHSGRSCSHKPRFILQQLGPPLYKTNCNTISPSAPEPISGATGRPSNPFPNFEVKFLKC